jgi:hypothetical protein
MIDKKDFNKLAKAIVSKLNGDDKICKPRFSTPPMPPRRVGPLSGIGGGRIKNFGRSSHRSVASVMEILNNFNVEQPVEESLVLDTSVESEPIVEPTEPLVGVQNEGDKDYVKEVRSKHRVVMRKNMPLATEKKLMEKVAERISIRQFHLEDETPSQMEQLDKEFEELEIKHNFTEMELVVNYIRKKLGQEDFAYLGKCDPNELEESVSYLLSTLSGNSIKEIVKELQSRKDRPELWPREANDVLLVPEVNKFISFIMGQKIELVL